MKRTVFKYYAVVLSVTLLLTQPIFSALIEGTLVKTPRGLIPIEQLNVDDTVLSFADGRLIENRIIQRTSKKVAGSYRITTPTTQFYTSPSQKLYDPIIGVWIAAADIGTESHFMNSSGTTIECIACTYSTQEMHAYDISLESPHNFLITNDELVVHNFAPALAIPLAWESPIAMQTLVFVLGLMGLKLFKNNQQKNQAQNTNLEPIYNCPGIPPEDPNKKKHPHGTYENAPYHHANSQGTKNPAPRNGQQALDNSIQISQSSSRRLGISEGELVVLDSHANGLFHGHVRTWKELTDAMKSALIKANLVNKKGKIL